MENKLTRDLLNQYEYSKYTFNETSGSISLSDISFLTVYDDDKVQINYNGGIPRYILIGSGTSYGVDKDYWYSSKLGTYNSQLGFNITGNAWTIRVADSISVYSNSSVTMSDYRTIEISEAHNLTNEEKASLADQIRGKYISYNNSGAVIWRVGNQFDYNDITTTITASASIFNINTVKRSQGNWEEGIWDLTFIERYSGRTESYNSSYVMDTFTDMTSTTGNFNYYIDINEKLTSGALDLNIFKGKYIYIYSTTNLYRIDSNANATTTASRYDPWSNGVYSIAYFARQVENEIRLENNYEGWHSPYYYHYIRQSVIPSATITDSDIIGGIKYKQISNSSENVEVGTVASAEISFTLNSSILYKGDKIKYYTKQRNDGNTFRQIGVFYVSSVEKDGNKYKVKAYDTISKFDQIVDDWILTKWTELHPQETMLDLFESLCTECGASPYIASGQQHAQFLNSNFACYKHFTNKNLKGRSVLQFIAQVAGGYCKARADGTIQFCQFGASKMTITNHEYVTKSVGENPCPSILQVNIAAAADSAGIRYPAGASTSALNIIGNPFLAIVSSETLNPSITTVATNIYNSVNNYSYYPAEIHLLEDYGLEAGDVITIDSKKVFIFSKEMSSSEVILIATTDTNRDLTSDSNSELVNLRGEFNILSETVSDTVRRMGNAEGNISTVSQTANNIKAQVTDGSGNYTVLTIDNNNVYIGNNRGEHVTISGDNINAGNLNLTGRIAFNDLNSSTQTLIASGSNIKQENPPTVGPGSSVLQVGQLWMNTGTPTGSYSAWARNTQYNTVNRIVTYSDGGTTYYFLNRAAHRSVSSPNATIYNDVDANGSNYWVQISKNCWYSYYLNDNNVGTWKQISNPYYITSTYIDSAKILSPTIIGNDMIVDTDGGGAFKIRKNGDTIGFMGSGEYRTTADFPGIVVSSDQNGDGIISPDQDVFLYEGVDENGNILLRLQSGFSYIEMKNDTIQFRCGQNGSVETLSNYARFA